VRPGSPPRLAGAGTLSYDQHANDGSAAEATRNGSCRRVPSTSRQGRSWGVGVVRCREKEPLGGNFGSGVIPAVR
jgi:hypothetical protein